MGGTGSHERAKRGEVVGWTRAAVRRQTRWLWSIEVEGLTGNGFALTLTVGDVLPTSEEWGRLRSAWLDRVARLGAIRTHWVVEWQARNFPHLHAAVYFPAGTGDTMGAQTVAAWLDLAGWTGARMVGQDCKPISGPLGWLKYLSKHAARGVEHYQRQGHPVGWEKTGRLWGHGGDWPVELPIEAILTNAEFYRLRRLIRSWRVAEARAAALRWENPKHRWARLVYARRLLRCPDRQLSRFRGGGEWIPQDVLLRLVDVATSRRDG